MSANPYASPDALRSAIADRLRPLARERGVELANLQRQLAYDRLLCRLFTIQPTRWVLKGGTAMLARIGPDARHTRDIDLLSQDGGLRDAERALHEAARLDVGDFFAFNFAAGEPLAEAGQALRVPVEAYLGVRVFARFHVDLVTNLKMTGAAEPVPGLLSDEALGLARAPYRVYPLVDHIADKVCALHETHERASGRTEPSSRYRDLADLAVFAHTASVQAPLLKRALGSEAQRRGMLLPERLAVPVDEGWSRGYARVAREAPRLQERDLQAALVTARVFIDPVLEGHAVGSWDSERLRWTG